MSKAWAGGSTRSWRKVRAAVLLRDQYRCRLRLEKCLTVATQVHHTVDRAAVGDDPSLLLSACAWCNQSTGSPSKHDPPASPGKTQW